MSPQGWSARLQNYCANTRNTLHLARFGKRLALQPMSEVVSRLTFLLGERHSLPKIEGHLRRSNTP